MDAIYTTAAGVIIIFCYMSVKSSSIWNQKVAVLGGSPKPLLCCWSQKKKKFGLRGNTCPLLPKSAKWKANNIPFHQFSGDWLWTVLLINRSVIITNHFCKTTRTFGTRKLEMWLVVHWLSVLFQRVPVFWGYHGLNGSQRCFLCYW